MTDTTTYQVEWTFGERLTKIRNELGLERDELAKRLDVHPKTLARWEHGPKTPSDLMGVTYRLRDLMTEEGKPVDPAWIAFGNNGRYAEELEQAAGF